MRNNLPHSDLKIGRKQHTEEHLKIIGKSGAPGRGRAVRWLRAGLGAGRCLGAGVPSRPLPGGAPTHVEGRCGQTSNPRNSALERCQATPLDCTLAAALCQVTHGNAPKPLLSLPRKACAARDRPGSHARRVWGQGEGVSQTQYLLSPVLPLLRMWSQAQPALGAVRRNRVRCNLGERRGNCVRVPPSHVEGAGTRTPC